MDVPVGTIGRGCFELNGKFVRVLRTKYAREIPKDYFNWDFFIEIVSFEPNDAWFNTMFNDEPEFYVSSCFYNQKLELVKLPDDVGVISIAPHEDYYSHIVPMLRAVRHLEKTMDKLILAARCALADFVGIYEEAGLGEESQKTLCELYEALQEKGEDVSSYKEVYEYCLALCQGEV